MTIHLLLCALASGFFSDGREAGCAAGPAAWAASASSGLDTPAGLVRIEGWECFSGISTPGFEGSFRLTAGGGWNPGPFAAALGIGLGQGEGESPDTLIAVISAAKVLTGNPIGFMEGLFGPSISFGGYLEIVHMSGDTTDTGILGGGGVQFSVFPSFAVGVNCRDLRLSGDSPRDHSWEYGITHVFNRDIRGHLTFSDGDVAAGADLSLISGLRISTGTDGSSWSIGTGIETGRFTIDYGLDMKGSGVVHTLSVSFSAVEGW
jgi:hypothetical protein